jgi:hypothetical protein
LSQRFGTDTIVLNSETLPDQSEFDDRWEDEPDIIYHLPEQAHRSTMFQTMKPL